MLIPGGMFHPAGTGGNTGSGSGPGSMGPPPNRLPMRCPVTSNSIGALHQKHACLHV
jgi:hypothetical protein